MGSPSLPSVVLWEITYACPLRCTHCYTESGRRPARQLALDEMLALADVLIAMKPHQLHIGGGEPLIVPGFLQVLERLHAGGLPVVVSTSGFGVTEEVARALAERCHSIHVSVDGPDAAIHDLIRGREGSFDEAMAALALFERLAGERKVRFGIDCTLVRRNFDAMPRFFDEVVPRFPHLEFVLFNGAVPNGLASRESYEQELIDDAQFAQLSEPAFARALRARAPRGLVVALTDNTDLQMRPERVRDGTAAVDFMAVEPDGMVRALPIYEGQVGDLRSEAPEVLWQRVRERRDHPFVVEQLSPVRTMSQWAQATRALNQHFASPADLVRIARRKPHA
jgi:MoaA/NifB/PqqE/SkfB family radical SAM enzyme